ncbi:MAG: hypothetical protein O3C11_03225 [Proteobacteria bacterium]|nr:hypothetical protein [Pseudomonadota bacterium]
MLIFNPDGTTSRVEFLVNATTSGGKVAPSITVLADGRFVIGWQDDSATGGDTSGSAIRAQIFDPRESGVQLIGSMLDDTFVGTRFGDVITGFYGDDIIYGWMGDDVLSGQFGDDQLFGGYGRDFLDGGGGNDKLNVGFGLDFMANGGNNDTYTVDRLGDMVVELAGQGVDWVKSANMSLSLMNYANVENAGLRGGTGLDTFLFLDVAESAQGNLRDIIIDFSQAESDRIDLAAIDAQVTLAGNQAFTFIGTASFGGTEGELRYVQNANHTFITADVNGDGIADLEIRLNGLHTLVEGDFIL